MTAIISLITVCAVYIQYDMATGGPFNSFVVPVIDQLHDRYQVWSRGPMAAAQARAQAEDLIIAAEIIKEDPRWEK